VGAARPEGSPPRPGGSDAGQGKETEMKKGGLRLCRLPPDFFSATECRITTPYPPGVGG